MTPTWWQTDFQPQPLVWISLLKIFSFPPVPVTSCCLCTGEVLGTFYTSARLPYENTSKYGGSFSHKKVPRSRTVRTEQSTLWKTRSRLNFRTQKNFASLASGSWNGQSPAAVERRTKATTESIESIAIYRFKFSWTVFEATISTSFFQRWLHSSSNSFSGSSSNASFFIKATHSSSRRRILHQGDASFLHRSILHQGDAFFIKATLHSSSLHSSSLHSSSRRRILHQGDASFFIASFFIKATLASSKMAVKK